MHPRNAIWRFGTWPHKRQAEASEPIERFCGMTEKPTAQFDIIPRFDFRRRELTRIFLMRLRIVVNLLSPLPLCTGGSK